MSTFAPLKAPEVFKAGAAVAPVMNWYLYDTIYTERYMAHPEDNKDGYKNSSPVNLAKNLQGDLLIIHGISDDNVHVQHTYQMIESLLKENKDYQFYAYPQKDHGIWGDEHRVHLFTRILTFFNETLKQK
jgi:dipeptidyl-peptidase-4